MPIRKKRTCLFFVNLIIIILSINFISATCTLTFDKAYYNSGETAQATMSCSGTGERNQAYTITWTDEDGTTLETDTGTTPSTINTPFSETYAIPSDYSSTQINAEMTGTNLEGSDSRIVIIGGEATTTVSGGGGGEASIEIFPRIPLSGDEVEYGTLPLEVQIYYAGKLSNGPAVRARSDMFGEVQLTHISGTPDGTYTANATVEDDALLGSQRIFYTATYSNQFNEASVIVNLKDSLKVNLALQEQYSQGETINFDGQVLNLNGVPVANAKVIIEGKMQENKIFEISTVTDGDGSFSKDYFVKYYDRFGAWEISSKAVSAEGKVGRINIPVSILPAAGVDYYFVNFLSPLKDSIYKRGEIIPITIEIKDNENLVSGASVAISIPEKELIKLDEVRPGTYSGEYIIKSDDEMGKLFLKADAVKELEGFKKVGGASIPIEISSTEISFSFISPDTDITYTNSRLRIKVRLEYPDGSLVSGGLIDAVLSNGKTIYLEETSDGIYEGEYFVPEEDAGSLSFTINAEDIGGNIGELTKTVYVKERTALGNFFSLVLEFLKKYAWAIVIFLFAAGLIYKPNFEIRWIKNRLEKAREEIKRIGLMQIETEKKYFKEGSLNKKEFRSQMEKYKERQTKLQELIKSYEKTLSEKLERYKR